MGLAWRNRLHNSQEFQLVFRSGKRIADSAFIVFTIHTNKLPRLGLAISKRKVPRAVDRNRIKRIIRASFRQNMNIIGSRDIVVLAQAKAQSLPSAQLHDKIKRHWQRLR